MTLQLLITGYVCRVDNSQSNSLLDFQPPDGVRIDDGFSDKVAAESDSVGRWR